MRKIRFRHHLMAACSLMALTLSACDKPASQNAAQKQPAQETPAAAANVTPPEAALPLATGSATAAKPAPSAKALPAASPARYAKATHDDYAYIDRAYAVSRAFGDAPPDFTYDYNGERPLVWRSDDGYQRVAERLPGGAVRYYYYRPGADSPFLVQDPDYAYGYSGDELSVVYDASGNIVRDDAAEQQARLAGQYLFRARALYAASVRQQREAVAEQNWQDQREQLYEDRQRWRQDRDHAADWRAYHDAHQDEEQAHWAAERYRRAAEAARFANAIKDATVAARAAQALADASAEARRFGQKISEPPSGGAMPQSNMPAPAAGYVPKDSAPNGPGGPDRGQNRHGPGDGNIQPGLNADRGPAGTTRNDNRFDPRQPDNQNGRTPGMKADNNPRETRNNGAEVPNSNRDLPHQPPVNAPSPAGHSAMMAAPNTPAATPPDQRQGQRPSSAPGKAGEQDLPVNNKGPANPGKLAIPSQQPAGQTNPIVTAQPNGPSNDQRIPHQRSGDVKGREASGKDNQAASPSGIHAANVAPAGATPPAAQANPQTGATHGHPHLDGKTPGTRPDRKPDERDDSKSATQTKPAQ